MSEKYKIHDPDAMYFVTMSVVGWVDLFTRPELKHVIINSLRYCQKEKELVIHAWCLMPSHLHLIISSTNDLSAILRDFKKFTSKEIVKTIEEIHESRKGWILDLFSEVANAFKRVTNYKVWQDGNHPIQLSNAAITRQSWITFTTIRWQKKLSMNQAIIFSVLQEIIIRIRKDILIWY